MLPVNIFVHGVHFGEEPISVISQLFGISQDVLHGSTTTDGSFENRVLLNQSVLESNGVLIEDARSIYTEVINYGDGFGA